MTYTRETRIAIYDDSSGDRWELRPSADVPGMVELAMIEMGKQVAHSSVSMPREIAEILLRELPQDEQINT